MKTTPKFLAVAAVALLGTARLPAQDATVATMLQIRPKFDDVAISTPTAEELKDCKVEDVKDEAGKKIGYALLDSRRQLLRRFVMTKGAAGLNQWSFYKDGVEVFRMSASSGKVDQYRWLGTGGMKWGVSTGQDGKIDTWPMISADEVAQEAFLALATGDFARLKALYITPAEIKALGLPDATATKMLQAQQVAAARFQQALAKQPGLTKANFVRVESAAPGCWLADSQGTPRDVIKHASRAVFFEPGDKKHDWFTTGEIIQVSHQTWRLVDLFAETEEPATQSNPKLNKLLADLSDLEKRIFGTGTTEPGKANPALAGLYELRSALCQQIIPEVEAKEKENWYKQLLDSMSGAVLAGSEKAKTQLDAYQKHFAEKMPGTSLAAYATYRQLWALYSPKLVSGDPKAQEAYNEQLVKFVKDYPRADDTADALHQLGMSCEFTGNKEKEEEAARYYGLIHTSFPEHHLAEWAKGAERRLRLAGNPLVLSGTLLTGNTPFDINQLKGKLVVVHYWASNTPTAVGDFDRLKRTLSGQKDVELVCVNLDDKTEKAVTFLQQNGIALQAYHIAQAARDPNGLRGALANYYGINVLPTVFLVGRDGRVISAKLQVTDLEEALKKAAQ